MEQEETGSQREQMRWPRQKFLQWYPPAARFRDTAGGGPSLPEPGHQFGDGSSSYNGRNRGGGSSFPVSGPTGTVICPGLPWPSGGPWLLLRQPSREFVDLNLFGSITPLELTLGLPETQTTEETSAVSPHYPRFHLCPEWLQV